jgi:hypothetical protein
MSDVVNLTDVRRRVAVPSIMGDAQRMIEVLGRRAGVVAEISARMPDVTDEERRYWVVLAEEIARIEEYSWCIPGAGRGARPGLPSASPPG